MVLQSVKSVKGKRDYMEDRYSYFEKDGIVIAMVCDGHGGSKVSTRTAVVLPNLLFHCLSKDYASNIKTAKAIRETISHWGETVKKETGGSTLTGIAMKNGIVYFYNVGDSRSCAELKSGSYVYFLRPEFNSMGDFVDNYAVDYFRRDFFCTVDHDLVNTIEIQRIEKAGGKVIVGRLNGILGVSRALGDADVGKGITHIPDVFWIYHKNLKTGHIVLYSDGIYEARRQHDNSNDAQYYHTAVNDGAAALVDMATKEGSEDNLTVLVL